MWKDHFKGLLNSSKDPSNKEHDVPSLRNTDLPFDSSTLLDVLGALMSFRFGQATGWEGG